MNKSKPKIIVICGPTATGKSDLAVDIALYVQAKHNQHCEIISADSRQIYKYLDLGTGKITPKEMKGVPHHGLDLIEPMEQYTVTDFQKYATDIIQSLVANNTLPIICGGTGQYIDYVVQDIELPPVTPNETLRATLEEKTIDELNTIFHTLNKDQTHHVDLKNKRKLIRAIEILESLGKIPEIKRNNPYDVLYIGLDIPDELLRDKIKKRIDVRLQKGMIEESRHLLADGKITLERMRALGLEYAFIADVIEEKITHEDFKEMLFFAIWHYAKRQRTWFKKNEDIHWFNPTNPEYHQDALNIVSEFIDRDNA